MAKNQQKVKVPAPFYPIPRDRDEADEFIYKIGEAIRDRALIQNACDATIASAKAQFEEKAAPISLAIDRLTDSLHTWCEANRAELLDGGGKTVKFGNGEVAWRIRPASVTLRGIEKIIEWCRTHRLTAFLRIKTEVNKEAMLANPNTAQRIPGVSIASAGEDFIVTPLSAELEKVAL